MIRALLSGLILLASPALATQYGWPALHDVVGVAEDDVLNIRADASAASAIIGTLAHDATNIEVIRPNDAETWGLVNAGETAGWVALGFMARQPGQFDSHFPEFTSCGGTEPFWSLDRNDGTATLRIFLTERPELTQPILFETGTVNHRHRYSFGTEGLVGVVSRQYCDDGMSDMEFGLELNLVLPGEGLHLQGCCSIQPRAE